MVRGTRLAMAGGLVAAALLAGGCSERSKVLWKAPHAEMETLSESSDEHFHHVARVHEMDRRGLAEDLDLLFLTDRPTRLSKWHSK